VFDDRRQKTENRCQKTVDREQSAEDREKMTGVGDRDQKISSSISYVKYL